MSRVAAADLLHVRPQVLNGVELAQAAGALAPEHVDLRELREHLPDRALARSRLAQ